MRTQLLKNLHPVLTFVCTFGIVVWTLHGITQSLVHFLFCYFILDLLLFHEIMQIDMMIHHGLAMSLICCSDLENYHDLKHFLLMEVSTPFLVLYRWNIAKTFNRIVFVLSFVYFRIIQIGFLLFQYRFDIHNISVWIACLLYFQNVLWLEKIMRILIINTPMIGRILECLSPYTHFGSILFTKTSSPWVQIALGASSIASYFWHTKRTYCFYLLDLVCLHALSFTINLSYSSNRFSYVSVPFHLMDLIWHSSFHQPLVLLSVGLDVLMIFLFYHPNIMWLFGWIVIGLLLRKQTFGYGSTQTIIHLLISILLSTIS